jgi:hypothetical protein
MSAKIKADVLKALDDWKAGKPVKSIELGHVHRMKETNYGPRVDLSVRLSNDQERAHSYLFYIIDFYTGNIPVPDEHSDYLAACDALEKGFRETGGPLAGEGYALTAEEADAAEGLAWKALHVGWRSAIGGHSESLYIEVSNPTAVQAT